MSIDPLVTEEGNKIMSKYDLGLEPILPQDVGYTNPRARPVYDALFSVLRQRGYMDNQERALVPCQIRREFYVDGSGHHILTVIADINLGFLN